MKSQTNPMLFIEETYIINYDTLLINNNYFNLYVKCEEATQNLWMIYQIRKL